MHPPSSPCICSPKLPASPQGCLHPLICLQSPVYPDCHTFLHLHPQIFLHSLISMHPPPLLHALPHSYLHSLISVHPLSPSSGCPQNGSCDDFCLSPQVGKKGHSSVEDARATMELYKVVEEEWEQHLLQNLEQK